MKKNLIKFLFALLAIFLFSASSVQAKVKFTKNTDLNFSNLSKGGLKVQKDSELQKITTFSKSLKVTGIVSNTPFVLINSSTNKVLSIEPVDKDTLDLTVSTTNYNSSTSFLSEWSLSSSKDLQVKQEIKR